TAVTWPQSVRKRVVRPRTERRGSVIGVISAQRCARAGAAGSAAHTSGHRGSGFGFGITSLWRREASPKRKRFGFGITSLWRREPSPKRKRFAGPLVVLSEGVACGR